MLATSPWWMTVSCNATDIVIKEEREENMETDALLDSAAPMPLKEKAMSEDLEARDHEDHCSHMSEESTDQNPTP